MYIKAVKVKDFLKLIAYSFLFVVLTVGETFGQYKYEKETRIKSSDLPFHLDIDFAAYNGLKRLKWYKEYNINQVHYEAKFRFYGTEYSVEFDSLGLLEDLEVLLSIKELESSVSQQLSFILNGLYENWKIDKIQKQYLLDQDVLNQVLMNSLSLENRSCNYEIELVIFEDGKRMNYEMLFDSELKLVRTRMIVKDSSLNLEF